LLPTGYETPSLVTLYSTLVTNAEFQSAIPMAGGTGKPFGQLSGYGLLWAVNKRIIAESLIERSLRRLGKLRDLSL
jgi:hypothetical protein